ncbi:MAG: hypothetical protein HY910_00120 [Desulfarculus sp.]|nr:hypothetical protein [Desulfarculus sp.]
MGKESGHPPALQQRHRAVLAGTALRAVLINHYQERRGLWKRLYEPPGGHGQPA